MGKKSKKPSAAAGATSEESTSLENSEEVSSVRRGKREQEAPFRPMWEGIAVWVLVFIVMQLVAQRAIKWYSDHYGGGGSDGSVGNGGDGGGDL
uniref:Uncharacterized protein n=1 Tax=Pseudictyota dubia TaxID=2749911 RepID=A0A7R9ZBH0_9STRA